MRKAGFTFAMLVWLSCFCPIALAQEVSSDNIQTGSFGPVEEQVNQKPIIVIDPGHGGIDPGAVSLEGLREKDLVLAFADSLALSLKMTGKFDVQLTRTTDKFVGLDARADFARKAKASLLISVHADSLADPTVRGLTIYGHSETASDPHAAALAQVENHVDKLAGVELSKQSPEIADVLVALAARESRFEAGRFAQNAVEALKPTAALSSHPLRAARFVVLKSPDVPSVLVELGFLSNQEDAALLNSVKWRDEIAEKLAQALAGHYSDTQTAVN